MLLAAFAGSAHFNIVLEWSGWMRSDGVGQGAGDLVDALYKNIETNDDYKQAVNKHGTSSKHMHVSSLCQ